MQKAWGVESVPRYYEG